MEKFKIWSTGQSTVRIAAAGDIHGKKYFDIFSRSLENSKEADIFLLAGDITEKSDLDGFSEVIQLLKESVSCPIVCVFGNEEYDQDKEEYRKNDIVFLDDESCIFEINGREIKIVGTTGSLDRPTWWQRSNIAGIWRTYSERIRRIDELLQDGVFTILLTHYAPTYATLLGEKEKYWPEMGSKKFEKVILERKPDIVIHGHSHRGIRFAELTRKQVSLLDFAEKPASIPVYNVALPVAKEITLIDV